MNDFVQALLLQRFMAHGFGMQRQSDVIWLDALSDAAIAAAYFCIAMLLLSFIRKQRDRSFQWIIAALSLFFICCGLTQAMDVATLWFPLYRLAGVLKAITAVVSVSTAVGLAALTPVLRRRPSLEQWQLANRVLDSEIAQRKQVGVELDEAYRQMDEKLQARILQPGGANPPVVGKVQFQEAFEHAAIGLALVAVDGRFLHTNRRFCEILGYTREELAEMTLMDITHADDLKAAWVLVRKLLDGTATEYQMENRYVRKDSELVWVSLTAKLISRNGQPDYIISAVENIAERKRAEALVLENERRFKELANAMPQIVWTATPAGIFDFYNDRWYELTGLQPSETLDDGGQSVTEPEDYARWLKVWRDSLRKGQGYEMQYRFWNYKRQEFRWYLGRATPVKDPEGNVSRWIGTCTDIHDQKSTENSLDHMVRDRTMALERSLLEKEILLKEIHHRVKNNLQVISSLLRMQSETLGTADAVAALKDSQRRVLSMALIHEQLYGGSRMDEIDFEEYVKALTDELFSSVGSDNISRRLLTSRLLLKIDHAIPCGLILSELVTNALKYAFPGHSKGEVVVELAQDRGGEVTLTVADNGVGLPAGFDLSSKNLGLSIVQILTKQIGGKLIVRTGPGARFSVVFRAGTAGTGDAEGDRAATQTA